MTNIKDFVDNTITKTSKEDIIESIAIFFSTKPSLQDVTSYIHEIVESYRKVEDPTQKLLAFEGIREAVSKKNIGDAKSIVNQGYSEALEGMGLYHEAIDILNETDPSDFNDNDFLEFSLKVGELYLAASDLRKAFEKLGKMQQHVFRLSTPKKTLIRYDIFRGNCMMRDGKFAQATQSFWSAFKNGGNCLRDAAICAVLMDPTPERRAIINGIFEVKDAYSLDVYPTLSLLAENKFIDRQDSDLFKAAVGNSVDSHTMNLLASSFLMHNLSVAQSVFKTVSIDRLGILFGEGPDFVYKTLRTMIAQKRINAYIDQPARMVQFTGTDINDDHDLAEFCGLVQNTSDLISE